MNARRFWIPFAIFFGLTPFMLFLGLMSAGAGHGDYFLAKILFPYTLLSTAAFESIKLPFMWLTLIQYPAYGVAIGLANVRRKLIPLSAALALVHALAVVGAFAFANPSFSGTFHRQTRITNRAGVQTRRDVSHHNCPAMVA
jgi:hypothetical protein